MSIEPSGTRGSPSAALCAAPTPAHYINARPIAQDLSMNIGDREGAFQNAPLLAHSAISAVPWPVAEELVVPPDLRRSTTSPSAPRSASHRAARASCRQPSCSIRTLFHKDANGIRSRTRRQCTNGVNIIPGPIALWHSGDNRLGRTHVRADTVAQAQTGYDM